MKRALIAALVLPAVALVAAPALVAPALGDTPPANAPKCHSTAPSDFNGDGYSDLAVSAPGAKDHRDTTGDVNVFAGGPSGLDRAGTLNRHDEPTPSFPAFGAATATGDFNGDGCADLVVLDQGGPSGAAAVYYGHPEKNLSSGFGYQQTIAAHSIRRNLEPVVAAGDVNGDGYADLLVATSTTIDGDRQAAGLSVIYGSKTGLHPSASGVTLRLGTKNFPGTKVTSEIDQIAVGDINDDGKADIAVGFSGGVGDKPGVDEIFGSKNGLDKVKHSQLWNRSRAGVPGADSGGTVSVALGNFRGRHNEDLAFAESGSPTVTILYGGNYGLETVGAQTWSKDNPRIKGATQPHDDVWGSTLVAGRFGTAAYDDLVIGDTGTSQISVLRGSAAHGLEANDNQLFEQGSDGVPGKHLVGNGFSAAMAVGYFGHGLGEDLAVGAPFDKNMKGTVTIFYGTTTEPVGLSTKHVQPLLKPSASGAVAASGDRFGAALPNS